MLTIVEEILLLDLDDTTGNFVAIAPMSLNYAMAGAVLMELALKNRLDSDLERLIATDATPTGDDILDPVLATVAQAGETQSARAWVERIAGHGDAIKEQALARLVGRGILREETGRFLWVFETRRYPMIDNTEQKEVKLRLLEVLLRDTIPDPTDVVLICLADACDLFDSILSQREMRQVAARIEQVAKLDLVGQAVTAAVRDLQATIATAGLMH